MLAAVVKKKTGENVKDYLTPRLFEKIGINAERFVWLKWPNGIDAEPATFATTEDNLRLAILYMNNGRWNDEQIVSEEFIREALSVRIKTDEAPNRKTADVGMDISFGRVVFRVYTGLMVDRDNMESSGLKKNFVLWYMRGNCTIWSTGNAGCAI